MRQNPGSKTLANNYISNKRRRGSVLGQAEDFKVRVPIISERTAAATSKQTDEANR